MVRILKIVYLIICGFNQAYSISTGCLSDRFMKTSDVFLPLIRIHSDLLRISSPDAHLVIPSVHMQGQDVPRKPSPTARAVRCRGRVVIHYLNVPESLCVEIRASRLALRIRSTDQTAGNGRKSDRRASQPAEPYRRQQGRRGRLYVIAIKV